MTRKRAVHSPRPAPRETAAENVERERRITRAPVPHIGNSVAGEAPGKPAADRAGRRRQRRK